MNIVKEEAQKIIASLPDNASWDDLMYQIYAKQKISKGLRDIKEGKVYSHEEVKKRMGL